MFVVMREQTWKFIDHSEASQWTNRTSTVRPPSYFGGTTNVIRALKLLACHNSGFHWRTAPVAIA